MTLFRTILAGLALALCMSPSLAQEPIMGDGLYNIVGDPEVAGTEVYGTARGWEIISGRTASGGFAFCAAVTTGPDGTWTFGYDGGGQWQMAILHELAGPVENGVFSIDGQGAGISGWSDGLWVVLWLNLPEYEAIAQGNVMDLQINNVRFRKPLSGTGAAALKVRECVQNRGGSGAAAATAPAPAAPQSYEWINFQPGQLGPHLVAAGTTPDGFPVYVCGVLHAGGFHPGTAGSWIETCSIGYGGQELVFSEFQTLRGSGRWQPFQGSVPGGAVEGGYEADGRKLYICRVSLDGFILSGKYRDGFRGCNVPHQGQERELFPFDILTF